MIVSHLLLILHKKYSFISLCLKTEMWQKVAKFKALYTDNDPIKQHCFTTHQWHGRCFERITASHSSQWILCVTAGWVNRCGGQAQLLVYVRYVYRRSQIKNTSSSENHWKPGQQERIFLKYWTALWHQMDLWSRCVGICADGAKAMTGRHSGVVTHM